MHLKIITELLALPNFQFVKMLEQSETSIHLLVELIEPVKPVCSTCVWFIMFQSTVLGGSEQRI